MKAGMKGRMNGSAHSTTESEQHLREIFAAAIAAVDGQQATSVALERITLGERVRLLAFGKAADAMVQGALMQLGDRLQAGLLVTKHGHLDTAVQPHPLIEYYEAGHPVPDAASLKAGDAVCRFVAETPDSDHLLVLISGGGSALVESLIDGLTLSDLQARTDELLASGVAIGEINRERRRLSRIKGGRLLSMLGHCRVTQLLISDVPGDRLADIASGPLVAVGKEGSAADDASVRVETHLVATNALARTAASQRARALGYVVRDKDGSLDGDVNEVAARLIDAMPSAAGEVVIFGGESTVVLPPNPGQGGRNQHLAALVAKDIGGEDELLALVCGTDGTDGPTDAAGGIVNGYTAAAGGVEALEAALQAADAGTWLESAGALVRTGPTGTNVMDLALLARRFEAPG